MTIWERVAAALAPLGVPMAAGGKFLPDTTGGKPARYLVYFVVDAPPEQHADNEETLRNYLVQVSIFDRTSLINLPDITGAMKAAGFTAGSFRELSENQGRENEYFGLGLDFNYLESEV